MSLSNFGQQFATKTLRKFYQTAVTPVITNTNYEGDIKKAGDRVDILSFLNDVQLSDYTAGSDMAVESIVDFQDQLIVEKRKYYNFPIDRLEDLFTYADDISDTLVENANKVLERSIDTYVLANAAFARAGSWVGFNLRVAGSGTSVSTMASIATSTTGATLTLQSDADNQQNQSSFEATDGNLYFAGLTSADVGKAVRLTSGTSYATEWYRILGVTDSNTATIENWDGALSGSDIPNGDILRGLAGGLEYYNGNDNNGGGDITKPTTSPGWGWELQAATATALTSSTIYKQVVEVAAKLDINEIPDTDRHLTIPPQVVLMLREASELQPAVAMAYEGVVINGRVGKVGGIDVHMAAGARVSQRAGHSSAAGTGAETTLTAGSTGYQILANHISFCTFAYKWAESRIVDAENQFAKKYQGLHLWGAKVPNMRRKAGSVLFGTV